MLWFLLVVTLSVQGDIIHGEIVGTFHSEQECVKKMREFHRDAEEAGVPIPPQVNFGCVLYNKRGV